MEHDFFKSIDYPMVIAPEPDGGYSVLFPDLPGCASYGDTIEEAVKNAKEAKELYLEERFNVSSARYWPAVPNPGRTLYFSIDEALLATTLNFIQHDLVSAMAKDKDNEHLISAYNLLLTLRRLFRV